jgi:ABC-type lipoprotein export system ATPase subunit
VAAFVAAEVKKLMMSQVREHSASPQTTPTGTLLRAQGIVRSFKMGSEVVPVLKGIDLSIRAGEFIAIEGRSGSGKSTLLHILGGLDSVDAGIVEFDGQNYAQRTPGMKDTSLEQALTGAAQWYADVSVIYKTLFALLCAGAAVGVLHAIKFDERVNMPIRLRPNFFGVFGACLICSAVLVMLPGLCLRLLRWGLLGTRWIVRHAAALAIKPKPTIQDFWSELTLTQKATHFRNTQFGFVFQFYHLLPELNVLENTLGPAMVELSTLGYITQAKQKTQRAMELLNSFGLGHRLTHRPSELSGGERQRVAIARALMNSPRILFADEPTGNLDDETGQQIMAVLEKLHREQRQTIVMVTHDRAIAHKADRILVLKDGKLEKAL